MCQSQNPLPHSGYSILGRVRTVSEQIFIKTCKEYVKRYKHIPGQTNNPVMDYCEWPPLFPIGIKNYHMRPASGDRLAICGERLCSNNNNVVKSFYIGFIKTLTNRVYQAANYTVIKKVYEDDHVMWPILIIYFFIISISSFVSQFYTARALKKVNNYLLWKWYA